MPQGPVTKWNSGTGFRMPTIDPTRALTAAQSAFGNIAESIRKDEAAESLAATNAEKLALATRKQDFAEGAGDRKILEEQRLQDKSNARALLANTVSESAGGSLAPEFFSNPEVQKVLDKHGQDFDQDKFVKDNKTLFSNSKTYHKTIYDGMLAEGESEEYARQVADQRTQQRWPTLDKDIAGKLFAKSGYSGGRGGSGSGTGAAGTAKMFSSPLSQNQIQDATTQFIEDRGISTGKPLTIGGKRIADFGDLDVVGKDIRQVISKFGRHGITPEAVFAILDDDLDEDNDLKWDPRKLTDDQIKQDFVPRAQEYMNQQRGTYDSKTGQPMDPLGRILSAEASAADFNRAHNQNILSRLSPQNATPEDRMSALQKALGLNPQDPQRSDVRKNDPSVVAQQQQTEVSKSLADEIAAVEEAKKQAATPEQQAAVAVEEQKLFESIGEATRSGITTTENIGGWLANLNKRYIGNDSLFAKVLQGKSGIVDDFKRGFNQ